MFMAARPYAARRRSERSELTRRRITTAVHELMDEGAFHESTVEQVADRAGISRATLYQHFRSRLDLVDAICERFDENPALLTIRRSVAHSDPDAAIDETLTATVAFWSSEDRVLAQLYGVAAIDPAARDLVERQREDRRGEMTRLSATLETDGWLRPRMTEKKVLAVLMLLTSYETFCELRLAGMDDDEIVRTLQLSARELLER
jgi:AcrR family transcriptional regulator